MKHGLKEARQAVANHLAQNYNPKSPPMLHGISCVADKAAQEAKRKTELFPNLHEYHAVLPPDFTTRWIEFGSCSMLCVVKRTDSFPPHTPMPGVFDAAVDMGPDSFARAIKPATPPITFCEKTPRIEITY